MRKEWRNILLPLVLLSTGVSAVVARQDPDKSGSSAPRDCVCLTVELTWGISRPEAGAARQGDPGLVPTTETEFSLEVMNGRVVELIDWPPQRSRKGENPSGPTPSSTETRAMARGIWHLGKRPEGRVRARIEAPIEASLVVRGADEAVGIPILAVLERPQRTPPQSRLMVTRRASSVGFDCRRPGGVGPGRDRCAGRHGARLGGVQHHLAGGKRSQCSDDCRASPAPGRRCPLARRSAGSRRG